MARPALEGVVLAWCIKMKPKELLKRMLKSTREYGANDRG